MDFVLFSTVMQKLLNVNVSRPAAEPEAVSTFEEKFCYHPALQPMYTAAALSKLIASMDEQVLYQIGGQLGTYLLLFRLEGKPFLVGPFVAAEFDEEKTIRVLVANHLPASYSQSIRLYYRAFPMLSTANARSAVLSCISAFSGSSGDYGICRVEDTGERPALPSRPDYSRVLDYSTLRQRYDLENRFLGMIETGDTENVLIAYREMHIRGLSENRYVNAIYQEPIIGLSMLRALARKAAERGGADIVDIEEITQRAVQKMIRTRSQSEQIACTRTMLIELTEAVREHRTMLGACSETVRKVISLLRQNYSQSIPMKRLAEIAGVSESNLSRTFHKETGMTIPQYLANLRCAHAVRLLTDSHLTVQEISAYVGYPDSNYFVKVFKKQFGMTPTEYRAKGK